MRIEKILYGIVRHTRQKDIGLIKSDNERELVNVARKLNPGVLDFPAWIIGMKCADPQIQIAKIVS